jgi:hypothetical protein
MKQGRLWLGADESAKRLREPEGAGGRVRQVRPFHAAAPSEKTLKGSKPQGRRCRTAFGVMLGRRGSGELEFLCGGSVLGLPLERSLSP